MKPVLHSLKFLAWAYCYKNRWNTQATWATGLFSHFHSIFLTVANLSNIFRQIIKVVVQHIVQQLLYYHLIFRINVKIFYMEICKPQPAVEIWCDQLHYSQIQVHFLQSSKSLIPVSLKKAEAPKMPWKMKSLKTCSFCVVSMPSGSSELIPSVYLPLWSVCTPSFLFAVYSVGIWVTDSNCNQSVGEWVWETCLIEGKQGQN